jgi:hypothetical protein
MIALFEGYMKPRRKFDLLIHIWQKESQQSIGAFDSDALSHMSCLGFTKPLPPETIDWFPQYSASISTNAIYNPVRNHRRPNPTNKSWLRGFYQRSSSMVLDLDGKSPRANQGSPPLYHQRHSERRSVICNIERAWNAWVEPTRFLKLHSQNWHFNPGGIDWFPQYKTCFLPRYFRTALRFLKTLKHLFKTERQTSSGYCSLMVDSQFRLFQWALITSLRSYRCRTSFCWDLSALDRHKLWLSQLFCLLWWPFSHWLAQLSFWWRLHSATDWFWIDVKFLSQRRWGEKGCDRILRGFPNLNSLQISSHNLRR